RRCTVPESLCITFATLSNLDLQQCPFWLCNNVQIYFATLGNFILQQTQKKEKSFESVENEITGVNILEI
ncbi:MAG: hypothetical protein MR646_12480, partial [Agathobacter sp.]|nr:hypothetical protein [Agathobacter sp.]